MSNVIISKAAYKDLMVLSPIEHRLVLFMAMNMDDENILELTPEIKLVFIQDMRDSGKRISVQSIHNAIRVLKKQGLIREVARSTYRVSRKLYSKVQGGAE